MNYSRILKKGVKGDDVKYIQSCLIALGYSCGRTGADGNFGSNTENAVKNYQKSHKDTSGKSLSVDGKVGEKTWGAIVRDYNNLNKSNSANYTRLLKKTSPLMKGEDVKYVQEKLISLGYNVGSTGADGKYGNNTYNAVKEFQKDNGLSADGIVGEKTWNALEKATSKSESSPDKVKYSRILKEGMSGDDVRYMKDCLFKMGYYDSSIKSITHDTFGRDTDEAVRFFQSSNEDNSGKALSVDGKIGEKTWGAIEREHQKGSKAPSKPNPTPSQPVSLDNFIHISADKREKIKKDLDKVSELRQKVCLEILNYAYDKDVPGDVRALYLFGANMYDTNLKINYADNAEIDRLANANPGYFNGGRKEWMKEQVKRSSTLPAADCSGCIVGYLRKNKLVDNNFDTTANNLCSNSYSSSISKSELKPGDWVGKSGHIGTYVGGGYVVEFYGGAFGCQLTNLDKRQGYDFINKKVKNGSAWTKYRRPSFY